MKKKSEVMVTATELAAFAECELKFTFAARTWSKDMARAGEVAHQRVHEAEVRRQHRRDQGGTDLAANEAWVRDRVEQEAERLFQRQQRRADK
jgi:hypothetical protein